MSAAAAAHLACGRSEALLEAAPEASEWLAPGERARLAVTADPRRQRQFLAARWLARLLLSHATGAPASSWTLDAGEAAPPSVRGPHPMHVSIAHSGEWVACACAAVPVGIDIEQVRAGRDVHGLATLSCTPSEQRLLDGAPDAVALFHELWTVKESWLKRRGEGLAPSRLVQLDAQPAADGQSRTWQGEGWWLALCADARPCWWSPEPAPGRRWRVADLRPA